MSLDALFEQIATDLQQQGYSIIHNALPTSLCLELNAIARSNESFHQAGIGRADQHNINHNIRRDSIRWIEGLNEAETQWQSFTEQLKNALNRQLFLGLDYYESHFAHYEPGAFYQKHLDAFKGKSNRVLSTVFYLNPNWQADWGGELVIYDHNHQLLQQVTPDMGKLVIFLSEEFPHEVKPAIHHRYSIAGWFRQR